MARKSGRTLFIFFLLFIAAFGNPSPSYAQSPILIDHNCAKLADIPFEWISAAKQNLHIAYGCSSHGSQLTTGMTGLVTWKGPLYSFNFGGTNGALDLREWEYDDGFGHPDATTYANDLGDPNRTAWAAATRQYLNAHPEINVVIWAWCYQMMTDIPADIDLYLNLMTELEEDFPNVKFVYMTGHVTAWQLWGPGTQWSHVHYMRAKQIRDYCAANNKILFDFADIESWDPDGNWYGDKLVDDACNYDSDGNGETDQNWAVNWQNAHPGEWYACESAHTEPLNANLKAYAAWWLWARLAGWTGEADIVLNSVSLDPASVPGGNPSTGTVTLSGPAPVGGTVVTLSSSDPAAQTPASVTVTAGETTGTFPVTTSPVGTDTPVTISGTHDSGTQEATLTVTASVVVPSLTVISPNGGESWATGSTHNITWTQTGLTGTVTVDLYKGGIWQKILGTPAATAGTFSWVIASNEIAGTDYRIRIWQTGVSDDSDANFTCTAAPIRKDDLVGTWDNQGVYYRNSDSGAWGQMASPASMVACGDLDNDGTDDLIGIWSGQGGVWVKYSSTGGLAHIASTAVHMSSGDMNGDGRAELLGTWAGQGVFYRNSATGVWVLMASPASMIASGDLDNDGTDDLIGIWPGQGGVWVKYSSTGNWAHIASTAQWIGAGDMNGDGRDELLGTWDGQGVYCRNSETGAWVLMASPATMITSGDLDGDGTDDLIGTWPAQGGTWVKHSTTGSWELLSSSAQYISAGKMRPVSGSSASLMELPLPVGGAEPGPEGATLKTDESSKGPGGWRFAYLTEPNLMPKEPPSAKLTKIPGPGEPGFLAEEQKNVLPGEAVRERQAPAKKTKKVAK